MKRRRNDRDDGELPEVKRARRMYERREQKLHAQIDQLKATCLKYEAQQQTMDTVLTAIGKSSVTVAKQEETESKHEKAAKVDNLVVTKDGGDSDTFRKRLEAWRSLSFAVSIRVKMRGACVNQMSGAELDKKVSCDIRLFGERRGDWWIMAADVYAVCQRTKNNVRLDVERHVLAEDRCRRNVEGVKTHDVVLLNVKGTAALLDFFKKGKKLTAAELDVVHVGIRWLYRNMIVSIVSAELCTYFANQFASVLDA